jgi:hypothetical protein
MFLLSYFLYIYFKCFDGIYFTQNQITRVFKTNSNNIVFNNNYDGDKKKALKLNMGVIFQI